ncbi:MAG: hypothetical protein COB53_10790 [Elusimicrobia bacterium]|nr:MAG: hypothetical protein COB53_10790 [Elusimicrobiota bacterium]
MSVEHVRSVDDLKSLLADGERPRARIGDEVRKLYGKELDIPKRPVPKKFKKFTKLEVQACMSAGVLILIFSAGAVFYFNEFVFYDEKCKAELSQIDKEYQRRADLIPALVEVAGEYALHEARMFNYVADTHSLSKSVGALQKSMLDLKKVSANPSAMKGVMKGAGGQLTSALGRLMALAEQYPQLKAMQSYKDLMDKLETTEDRIATMRENYIRSARQYNTIRETFPSGIFNYFYGFPRKDYYLADNSRMPQLQKQVPGGVRVSVLKAPETPTASMPYGAAVDPALIPKGMTLPQSGGI